MILALWLIPGLLYTINSKANYAAYSQITNVTLSSYFKFLFVNLFIIFLISGSIFEELNKLLDDVTTIASTLGRAIPTTSTFFTVYIMTTGLVGLPIKVSLIGNLIGGRIKRRFLAKTAKQEAACMQLPPLDISQEAPLFLVIFSITLTYASMAPIILPFSVMYYGLAYLVIKQQLLCCVNTGRACSLWEPKEYDGAGTAMRSMINLTLFGLIMALVLNAAYFSIRESWPAAGACLAPIPFIVWKWCKVCSQFAQVEAHLLSNLEEQETKDPEPIDPRDLFSTEHNKDSLDCEQSHENPCFYQQPCLLKHHSCSYWSYAVMPPPAEQDKSPEPTKPASTNSWFSHAAVEVVVPSPRSRASSDTPCVDGCDCVKCVAGDDVAADLIASEVARASLNPEELGRSAEEQEEDELARMIAEAEAIAEQAEAASVTPMGSPVETEPVVAAVAAEVEHPIESVAAGAAEECAAESADTAEPVSYTHLRAHETVLDLVCRLLLEKKKKTYKNDI
eukprot:TRINITY_DN2522_c0_g1_i1.p1 TRINITY_DN2522_c0_g1~~TRINITY_DN2522_c0_g1_i1.p1  ORF type:complete len:507 (-),score=137.58 TRINITY_DN2522_c0_g1_i1:36-1556(-)